MQHHFDVELACKYGMLEAILLNHFQYWLQLNEANNKNFYDGRYWTFNSMKAFGKIFSYVSEKKIRNALKHLQEEELIVIGNYNKVAYDRTLWYAFTEKGKSILLKGQMEIYEKANRNLQKGEPIPDNITYNIPDNNGSGSIGEDDNNHHYHNSKSYIQKYLKAFPTCSSLEIERLSNYEDEGMEDEVICIAIDEAITNNVRKLKYIEAILNNWLGNNIKTVIQLDAYKQQRNGGANFGKYTKGQVTSNTESNKPTAEDFRRFVQSQQQGK